MYNHLSKFEKYQYDPSYLEHFDLLVNFVKMTYTSTTKRLITLLEDHEITYKILWALFRPTTNRINQIDDAIASRTHLPLKYRSLGLGARRGIWESFLNKVVVKKGEVYYSREDLDFLAKKDLNGR